MDEAIAEFERDTDSGDDSGQADPDGGSGAVDS